jgi:lysophospholipase L1-like esterase
LTGSGGGTSSTPQANQLAGLNPDMVTLSIGGNDVGFADLLVRVSYFRQKTPGLHLANVTGSVSTGSQTFFALVAIPLECSTAVRMTASRLGMH